ncbi:MAG: acyl-CoA synthetase FdrA [Betaproteobacteria bacterium]|nr:acyl-CoA synthetase FdrA [Betaproteobacteria bacterium]
MPLFFRVIPNVYRDSVSLMQLSSRLAEGKGIEQVAVVMATPANLDLLREAGFLDGVPDAKPSDVLALVKAKSAVLATPVLDQVTGALAPMSVGTHSASIQPGMMKSRSLGMALDRGADANLALISVPGEYAAAEAEKALDRGLNVMLFSDNVSLEDEVALKSKAASKHLLMMGPDCGTAIIDGMPLGFANAVRRGRIGCIGASGTGLQQVTSLIDGMGEGISQAIGTGGRDLSKEVGGRTMLAALKLLARDPATAVIVLIAKPPHPEVATRVIGRAAKIKKPVIVCFIGDGAAKPSGNLRFAQTLDEAARVAVAVARGKRAAATPTKLSLPRDAKPRGTKSSGAKFIATQQYIRGLYSGGTFCYEASMLLAAQSDDTWSNASVRADRSLDDPWQSRGHSLIDLGDDVFTRGRPHPMIDHRLRNERMLKEAGDASVAVILLDIVLGHGADIDPAVAMSPAIGAARARAAKGKRRLVFVGFICGTLADPQDLTQQTKALTDAGVVLARSNAEAVRLAAAIVKPLASKALPSQKGKRS